MGKIYNEAMAIIRRNRDRRISGKVNAIPFALPRFCQYVPGVVQENITEVTANSGVGKSKLTKKLYVIDALDFVLANPQMGIKLDINYFCLEESRTRFIQSLMCSWLHKHYGVRVPIKKLLSQTEILDEVYLKHLAVAEAYFDIVESMLHIHDDVRNPYGIYKRGVDFCEASGTWTKKTILVPDQDKKGEMKAVEVKDRFVPNHPDHYKIMITDHISLLTPEKTHHGSLHAAISDFSSSYCVSWRDKYFCSVVNVHQQAADQEKKQYTFKGQSIESKLEPSLDGLGDNKMTQRDANEVFGLFAPDRYEIANHRNYRVDLLEDNYRSLIVLKNRDGESNIRVGLFFDGATNHYEELQGVEKMTDEVYAGYLARVGREQIIDFQ